MFYFSYHKSSERNEGVTFVFCADFFKAALKSRLKLKVKLTLTFLYIFPLHRYILS